MSGNERVHAGPTDAVVDRSEGAPGLPIDAGEFGQWLRNTGAAASGLVDADVPCGSCTACCTSSQFVHIMPDEVDAIAHIPAQLLFPAPLMPVGHMVMGHDRDGRCPMLASTGCSIYEHRPRTCRTYDCRVFAASAVELDDDPPKAAIAHRAALWRFSYASDDERVQHRAIEAAAAWLREHAQDLPERFVPSQPTHLAVLAVDVHEVFVERDDATSAPSVIEPSIDAVRVAIAGRRHRPT